MRREDSHTADSVLFEGMTSVRAVIDAAEKGISDRRIVKLYCDAEKKKNRAKELGWLGYKSAEMGFEIEYISSADLDAMTTGSTHGGIAAQCSDRTIPPLTDSELKKDGFYVMLEGIEDPYNFGYAIRSLYACGADGIVLSPRNWMSAAGVVCRSSAGASEMLPVYESDASDAVDCFRRSGYRVLCAGIRDSESSFDCDMKKPLFLIVGGEKRGISSAVLEKADAVVRIDYGREFRGSLSAASAASVLAYEVMRQNRR